MENKKKYKSVISGGYGLYNFGDDALMFAIYKRFQSYFESGSIVFQCLKPEYLKKLVPKALVISRLSRSNIVCENFILGGGTLFYSFIGDKKPKKKNAGELMIYFIMNPMEFLKKILLRSRILKLNYEPESYKRSYALGIGLGPFDNGRDTRMKYAIDFCRKCSWVSVRDIKSLEYLGDWQVDQRFLGADICFAPGIFDLPLKKRSQIRKIGVIVRDWNKNENGEKYMNSIFESLPDLRGYYEVSFIVFSNHSDGIWINELNSNGEEYISWDPNTQTISDFLNVLNEFDLFITARYHGFIFASLLNIPSVCIEIEPKLLFAHEAFKESSFLWSYPFLPQELKRSITFADKNISKLQETLSTDVAIQSAKAEEMFKTFEQKITQ